MNPILMNPKIDDTASVQIQLKQMKSYLFQFKEQVELLLQNIDKENLSGNLVEDLDTIRGGIRQYEVKIDGFSSKIAQTANMVSAKLSSEDVDAEFIIGRLNDGSTYARISADRIDVDGVFTANGSFEIDRNGNLTFKGAGLDIDTASETNSVIKLNSGTFSTRLTPSSINFLDSLGKSGIDTYIMTEIIGNVARSNTQMSVMCKDKTFISVVNGASRSELRVSDGTTMKAVHWTPLNSLTSDMYVLTDGGT